MKQEVKIFGAALDPLSSPERLNLKLSYLDYLRVQPKENVHADPYDILKEYLRKELPFIDGDAWFGKMKIDSWLTPKPQLEDLHLLNSVTFSDFLSKDGCWDYAMKTSDYVENNIFPSKPVMIGVDHSLTGGTILALSRFIENLNVIVLDAHFDVLRFQNLDSNGQGIISDICPGNPATQIGNEIRFYECGNFLSYLLEKELIRPENLWILGAQDEILESLSMENYASEAERAQIKEYKRWIKRGVHVIPKTDLLNNNLYLDIKGPSYLSIDMDVGSLSSVFSARFMNCIGLTYDEFVNSLWNLAQNFSQLNIPIVGLDIMEIDIHLLEATELHHYQDHSKKIVKEIFQTFL